MARSNQRFCILALAWFSGSLLAAEPSKVTSHRLSPIRVTPNKPGFETEDRKPFIPMGVNYYRPGTGWSPQLWKKFDAAATRKDFARMKELGVNCVRVFLTYGSFYTEQGRLMPEGVTKFDRFLELAEEAGIYVHPTGPDHWEGMPDWAKTDRIADEKALQAVEDFWRQFVTRYRGRSVIFAYDLLNEPHVAWDSPPLAVKWNRWLEEKYHSAGAIAKAWSVTNELLRLGSVPVPDRVDCAGCRRLLDFQHFREQVADDWTRRQVAVIKVTDPKALVTVGLVQWSVPSQIDAPAHYSAFRPERQAKFLDFMEVHFYPLDGHFYEYASQEDEDRNLAYLEGVVREVAKPGKPVVIAEFGWYGGGKPTFNHGKHAEASDEQQAHWCRRVVETTSGLATGWLNWGFYDHPEATDSSQLSGLLTHDGRIKAWGRHFQELVSRFNSQHIPPKKLGSRPPLDWDLCITSAAKRTEFRKAYYTAWKAER